MTCSVSNQNLCDQCEKQFTCQYSLTKHIESVHEKVKYTCNQCNKQFTDIGSLRKHIQSVHLNFMYRCDQCHKQFTQKSSLRTHIQSLHDGVNSTCVSNNLHSIYINIILRNIPIQSIHERVKYRCDQCDKQFSHKETLKRHI